MVEFKLADLKLAALECLRISKKEPQVIIMTAVLLHRALTRVRPDIDVDQAFVEASDFVDENSREFNFMVQFGTQAVIPVVSPCPFQAVDVAETISGLKQSQHVVSVYPVEEFPDGYEPGKTYPL